jgi:hypothetical protein
MIRNQVTGPRSISAYSDKITGRFLANCRWARPVAACEGNTEGVLLITE